jgi:hypothetical protein
MKVLILNKEHWQIQEYDGCGSGLALWGCGCAEGAGLINKKGGDGYGYGDGYCGYRWISQGCGIGAAPGYGQGNGNGTS